VPQLGSQVDLPLCHTALGVQSIALAWRPASARLIGSAQRILSVITRRNDLALLDQPETLQMLKRFLVSRHYTRIRVLLGDEASAQPLATTSPFLALARRLTSAIELRASVASIHEEARCLLIADDHSTLRHPRTDNESIEFHFADTQRTYPLLRRFDLVWVASAARGAVHAN
jgi:hypothetical protein